MTSRWQNAGCSHWGLIRKHQDGGWLGVEAVAVGSTEGRACTEPHRSEYKWLFSGEPTIPGNQVPTLAGEGKSGPMHLAGPLLHSFPLGLPFWNPILACWHSTCTARWGLSSSEGVPEVPRPHTSPQPSECQAHEILALFLMPLNYLSFEVFGGKSVFCFD